MSEQAPKKIYLQSYDSDCYDDNTWCVDQINDEDIEYILQSEYDKLRAENERLKMALREIIDTSSKYKLENDDNSNNYWEWDDNALALLIEIDKIVEQALNEVTK